MIRRLKKLEKKLNILIVDGDVSEAEELESLILLEQYSMG